VKHDSGKASMSYVSTESFSSGRSLTTVSSGPNIKPPKTNLLDSGFPPERRVDPIEPRHRMVGIWRSSLEEEVMRLLEKLNWSAVDVLRMGFSPNARENPPTIIITVSEN